jgi:hypothetical protein
VLGVSILLAMAKDTSGLRLIAVGEMFFRLINHSIILQLQGPFQEHFPVSLEFRTLEAMRPSFLTSAPSLTYTLIRP